MEWKSKDLAIMRNLFREQVDESLKKKDRGITISFYEDSVSISVLPYTAEEDEYEQFNSRYETDQIFSVDFAIPAAYRPVTALYYRNGVCVDSCRAVRRSNGTWCDMKGDNLKFTPTHWTTYAEV